MRLLLLIVAIVAVFLAVRTLVRSSSNRKQVSRGERPERLKEGGAVIRCAFCGVHVPEAEAYRDGDRLYCSRQHAEVDRSRSDADTHSEDD
ncbi:MULTISPECIES: PP0621 family protein [unclassified Thioalkalivibrio]|uniref:PP0621 family protein n=1 Tax=unclassified Thioalkalivibrio TaxID=2621013 RepID=UPI00036761C2|nr:MULTISPECIES: PP0621 family protein [unclassified Thioalkalivibrio]